MIDFFFKVYCLDRSNWKQILQLYFKQPVDLIYPLSKTPFLLYIAQRNINFLQNSISA